MNTSTLYTCPFCPSSFSILRLYVSHLSVIHSKDPKFSIICCVEGCREVKVYFQLLTATFIAIIVGVDRTEGHLTLPDSSDACSSTSTSVVIENQIGVPGQVDEVAVSFSNFPCQEYCYENQSCNSFEYQQTLTAAKMLLELREGHQVSQVAIADIVSNCRLLCSQSVKHLKNNVTAVVSTSDSFNHDVQHVLQQEYDPFKIIDTNYSFERFCVDHLGLLVDA